MNMLFTNNRKLNYDEAVRRIAYWASQPSSERANGALKMLAGMLKRDRKNLYFEEV